MNPSFTTPEAQERWDTIPPHFQEQILHNLWCPHCRDMTTMAPDFWGEIQGTTLVLHGACVRCEGRVARVLEGEKTTGDLPVSEKLKPGDKVTWCKRIPGGNYVYPVQATVLALTAKRVKIEADDNGKRIDAMMSRRGYHELVSSRTMGSSMGMEGQSRLPLLEFMKKDWNHVNQGSL